MSAVSASHALGSKHFVDFDSISPLTNPGGPNGESPATRPTSLRCSRDHPAFAPAPRIPAGKALPGIIEHEIDVRLAELTAEDEAVMLS